MKKLLLAWLLLASPAWATTYYVGKSGSDSNSCATVVTMGATDQTKRKLTINAALGCMTTSDTLIIGNGTYAERLKSYGSTPVPSGASGSPTTLQAENSQQVTIRPADGSYYVVDFGTVASYITFDGLVVDGTGLASDGTFGYYLTGDLQHDILVKNGTVQNCNSGSGSLSGVGIIFGHTTYNMTARNMEVHHSGEYAFYISGHDSIVEDCYTHDNNLSGTAGHNYIFHMYHASGSGVDANIIRRCRVNETAAGTITGAAIFLLSNGNGNLVYNNIVYGATRFDRVFMLNYAATNTGIYNNTTYNNSASTFVDQVDATGTLVKNNISYLNGSNTIVQTGGGVITTANNTLGTNPNFFNAGGADFHLTSASTNERDQGTTLTEFSTDFEGNTRPVGTAWDRGAYEFVAGGSPPPPGVIFGSTIFESTVIKGTPQ